MCDPTSLAIASLSMTALSTGASAYGAYQQGQAQKSQAEYQARVAERNAEIAGKNAAIEDASAKDALQRGADKAAMAQERAQRVNATLRANAGGSGVQNDTGSALSILTQNAGTGTLDALTELSNAQREAYGFKVQAWNNRVSAGSMLDQAGGYRMAGANAANAGLATAGGTLLTGFGSIGKQAYDAGWFKASGGK